MYNLNSNMIGQNPFAFNQNNLMSPLQLQNGGQGLSGLGDSVGQRSMCQPTPMPWMNMGQLGFNPCSDRFGQIVNLVMNLVGLLTMVVEGIFGKSSGTEMSDPLAAQSGIVTSAGSDIATGEKSGLSSLLGDGFNFLSELASKVKSFGGKLIDGVGSFFSGGIGKAISSIF